MMTQQQIDELEKAVYTQPKDSITVQINDGCMGGISMRTAGSVWDPLRTEVWEPVMMQVRAVELPLKGKLRIAGL